MSLRSGGWSALLLTGVAWGAACTKLPEAPFPGVGEKFGTDSMPDSSSVPAKWGNLVTVTINPAYTDVWQLWFQDSTGSIRVVVYRGLTHKMSLRAGWIPRK
jgi:hypothetical protein